MEMRMMMGRMEDSAGASIHDTASTRTLGPLWWWPCCRLGCSDVTVALSEDAQPPL